MIPGNGDGIEVPHIVIVEILLNVAHHFQGEIDGENAGILSLVLFEYIGLNGSPDLAEGLFFYLTVNFCRQNLVAGNTQQHQTKPVVTLWQFSLVQGPLRSRLFENGGDFFLNLLFKSVLADVLLTLLVDGGIHEVANHGWRRPVDGH